MGNRKIDCVCGGLKDYRAKWCERCRKNDVQNKKVLHHTRICSCGQKKHRNAQVCLKCRSIQRLSAPKISKTRAICYCGSPKSDHSSKCLKCSNDSRRINDEIRYCTICNNSKPKSQFYVSKAGKARSICKVCQTEYGRQCHIALKCRRYGLSQEEAKIIAGLKSVTCAICETKISQFHLDHCHDTGKFRGILCSLCNSGLGMFNDNEKIMLRAIDYLKQEKYVIPGDNQSIIDDVKKDVEGRKRYIYYDGKSMTLVGWAKHLGVSESMLSQRLFRGWTIEETLGTGYKGVVNGC